MNNRIMWEEVSVTVEKVAKICVINFEKISAWPNMTREWYKQFTWLNLVHDIIIYTTHLFTFFRYHSLHIGVEHPSTHSLPTKSSLKTNICIFSFSFCLFWLVKWSSFSNVCIHQQTVNDKTLSKIMKAYLTCQIDSKMI